LKRYTNTQGINHVSSRSLNLDRGIHSPLLIRRAAAVRSFSSSRFFVADAAITASHKTVLQGQRLNNGFKAGELSQGHPFHLVDSSP
jgi:uncharacterized protein (DUF1778 family)